MGFFSSSKPKEPPKPTPEELEKAEKEAKYKQYLIDFENSKKILVATIDLKRDYEIIGIVYGYQNRKEYNEPFSEDDRTAYEDLKLQAYRWGGDAVIGVRRNEIERTGGCVLYGTVVKFI